MASQPNSESQLSIPPGIPHRVAMDVIDRRDSLDEEVLVFERRLAEILVADRRHSLDVLLAQRHPENGPNVDNRLRRESGHRGTAAMLDRHDHVAKGASQPDLLLVKSQWPGHVVVDD